jgi:hypothetical protein
MSTSGGCADCPGSKNSNDGAAPRSAQRSHRPGLRCSLPSMVHRSSGHPTLVASASRQNLASLKSLQPHPSYRVQVGMHILPFQHVHLRTARFLEGQARAAVESMVVYDHRCAGAPPVGLRTNINALFAVGAKRKLSQYRDLMFSWNGNRLDV